MPELAEVEHFRRRWAVAVGERIRAVGIHRDVRVFRECDVDALVEHLPGRRFVSSQAAGKQMLFGFSGGAWLGVHLGMTGSLEFVKRAATTAAATAAAATAAIPAAAPTPADRHEHLVLETARGRLVFRDPRLFGRVRFDLGRVAPQWWRAIPPPLASDEFTPADLSDFLERRAKSPLKAVLLMQERFPGVGNWMADEILWRAELHPARRAGGLDPGERRRLYHWLRWVCRESMRLVAPNFDDPPATWLFTHRWSDGGICPRTGHALVRETIGGRTTCWSPGRQRPPRKLVKKSTSEG